MNRKQRKTKQQRANQHRKVAKTVEDKRKQTESQIAAYREYDRQCDEYTKSLEREINHQHREWRILLRESFIDVAIKILLAVGVLLVLTTLGLKVAEWVSS